MAEIHEILKQAFGEEALGLKWFKKSFKCLNITWQLWTFWMTFNEHNARKCKKICKARQMVHDICNIVLLSYGTCQCILLDEINMRQIDHCCRVNFKASDWWQIVWAENLHGSSGYESWVYEYDPAITAIVYVNFFRYGDQWKRRKSKTAWRQCWCTFLTQAGLSRVSSSRSEH